MSYPATLEYDIDPIRDFLRPWPDLLATDVPQCIFVLEDGYPVVALRGNGRALLGDGSEIDVLALLRSGLQLVEIADVVRRSSGLPGPHIKRSTPGVERLRPLVNPVPIPPPDSTWSSQQVERLADWQSQRLLDQPWSCVMRDGRLHVLRESTGQPMFEAGFVETAMGWRVADLSVNSDQITGLETVGAAIEFLNVMEQLVAEQHDRTDPAA